MKVSLWRGPSSPSAYLGDCLAAYSCVTLASSIPISSPGWPGLVPPEGERKEGPGWIQAGNERVGRAVTRQKRATSKGKEGEGLEAISPAFLQPCSRRKSGEKRLKPVSQSVVVHGNRDLVRITMTIDENHAGKSRRASERAKGENEQATLSLARLAG